MPDDPQADVSPSGRPVPVTADLVVTDTNWGAVPDQLIQVFPRLAAIGSRIAVLAPILIGLIDTDSFGRGVGCN